MRSGALLSQFLRVFVPALRHFRQLSEYILRMRAKIKSFKALQGDLLVKWVRKKNTFLDLCENVPP